MKAGFRTDRGRVREINEDAVLVDLSFGLFIAADGMGGHAGGEIASGIAVETISQSVKDSIRVECTTEEVYQILMDALTQAHETIVEQTDRDNALKGMGTTIVLALQHPSGLYVAHVGDSRAYLIKDRAVKQLTKDHTVVAQIMESGVVSRKEAKKHRLRHVLSQALGSTPSLMPGIQVLELKSEEYVLLCTDGLTDLVEDSELRAIVLHCKGEPQRACEDLIELANERGGRDNITAILLYEEG